MNRSRAVPVRKVRRALGLPGPKVPPMAKECRKRRYPSYEEALRAVVRRHCPYPLRIYKCESCDGGYHLTKRTTWEDQ